MIPFIQPSSIRLCLSLPPSLFVSVCLLLSGDPAVLWEAVVFLETAKKHTQTNPQLSLLLLKLYAHLGVAESCTRLFNSLAIKHIQLDTIG